VNLCQENKEMHFQNVVLQNIHANNTPIMKKLTFSNNYSNCTYYYTKQSIQQKLGDSKKKAYLYKIG